MIPFLIYLLLLLKRRQDAFVMNDAQTLTQRVHDHYWHQDLQITSFECQVWVWLDVTMMTVRRSKKWNVINIVKFQKWYLLFSKAGHYVALFQKFVDTPVNGGPFFRIDSVYQMETSLYHALLVH
jgi:hypothetical protein